MLREKLRHYKIILASGSPRRQQFFRDLDIDFSIDVREVDEVYPDNFQAEEITNYLAKLKADAFDDLKEKELLVTSDTIVWHKGKALGKPVDYNDAFAILCSLSGDTHEVITSVCFKSRDKTEVLHDVTKVTFNPVDNADIHYYLSNYKPYDKAGAYGIQEWIGFIGVSKIEGSYANVMGLPVDKVYQYLKNLPDV